MDVWSAGPGEPEEADREKDGTEDSTGETRLRRSTASRRRHHRTNVKPVPDGGEGGTNDHATSDTEEGEAADARRPVAVLLENDGEGLEKTPLSACAPPTHERRTKGELTAKNM